MSVAHHLDPGVMPCVGVTRAGYAPRWASPPSSWLPDAHRQAPAPGVRADVRCALDCGFYVLLRFKAVARGPWAWASEMLFVTDCCRWAVAASRC